MKLLPYLLFGASMLVLACDDSRDNTGIAGEQYLSLTEDGAWCWFSDPRAVYYEGNYRRTYAGWVDSTGNIAVGFYDQDTRHVSTKVVHENFERDDHDNPSLFFDGEGKLTIFYSKHATEEPIYLLKAAKPEAISDWEPRRTLYLNDSVSYSGLSNTYTYTNIVQLSEERGRMFLFWRGADFKPNASLSDDLGQSWEPGKILVLPERTYRNRRPYIKVATNYRDAIHFAFTDGHPNAEPVNSIYYFKYQRGTLSKANGDSIMDWNSLPLNPDNADLVYDASATGEKAWIWDVAESITGNPVIVYSRFPNDSTHLYCYASWDGKTWSNHQLVNSGKWFPQTSAGEKEREPNYSGGIVLDHEDPNEVYLSVNRNGTFEIEKWSTRDGGKSWSIHPITTKSARDNVRPFVVRGHSEGGPSVMWMSVRKYRHYTDYATAIKMDVTQR